MPGDCHKSGCLSPHYSCTSPMDYNSHHSLHYDTHIPIHHCTNYTAVTDQPWLSCHTCTSFTHPHISSTLPYTRCEVLFLPRLTFLSVYHSLWLLLLCLTPDCLTLELWTCACDLDPCLVLFTSLLCLWYSCYCPLTIACLILPLSNKYCCTWIHTPLTSLYRDWVIFSVKYFISFLLFVLYFLHLSIQTDTKSNSISKLNTWFAISPFCCIKCK